MNRFWSLMIYILSRWRTNNGSDEGPDCRCTARAKWKLLCSRIFHKSPAATSPTRLVSLELVSVTCWPLSSSKCVPLSSWQLINVFMCFFFHLPLPCYFESLPSSPKTWRSLAMTQRIRVLSRDPLRKNSLLFACSWHQLKSALATIPGSLEDDYIC